jgi:hypothetical protein
MAHTNHGLIGSVKRGSDFKIEFDVQDAAGDDREYDGASLAATIYPEKYDDSFSLSPTLGAAADTAPQFYIEFKPSDTSSLAAPQKLHIYCTVTLASGAVDKPSGYINLLPDSR